MRLEEWIRGASTYHWVLGVAAMQMDISLWTAETIALLAFVAGGLSGVFGLLYNDKPLGGTAHTIRKLIGCFGVYGCLGAGLSLWFGPEYLVAADKHSNRKVLGIVILAGIGFIEYTDIRSISQVFLKATIKKICQVLNITLSNGSDNGKHES